MLPAGVPDGWRTGYWLRGVRAGWRGQDDTPAPGALAAGSIQAMDGEGMLTVGPDILVDEHWGVVTRVRDLTGPVRLNYEYSLLRVDALIEDDHGWRILRGRSHLTNPWPPAIPKDSEHWGNIFVPYHSDGLGAEFLPIGKRAETLSERAYGLKRWRAAVSRGGAVVTCLGDSVTAGASAAHAESTFPALLQARIDRAGIAATVKSIAAAGSSSATWLDRSMAGTGTDWARVEATRPDVVVVEFVNDAGLAEDRLDGLYGELLRRTESLSADLVLCEPHFTRLDWMPMERMSDPDPRRYVSFLRRFADRHGVPIVAVSRRWEALFQEGIPYVTLLVNGINHPDDRGHAIYAEEISAVLGV